ncbi:CGG triplet repeat-binding protein 1 [Rhizophagus clarus]|uniref:CGG triplet repeat-binding protein 1 n=1 Tax=Rhizophagus clarus TaxID=94130 RepID=A0A8H3LIL0_9GLOM|nr:CGG triplet repeat-binding protein 1 [Rhizophagus clarus]
MYNPQCNEYKDIFHVDDNILFCNYCNIAIDWKYKSIVKNYCKSQKHISNVRNQEEDLIEAFTAADIPLKKVNSLLPFFKKHIKNEDSIPQAPTLRQVHLPNVFNKQYQLLKSFFNSKLVAIIVDETTDDYL